MVERAIDNPAVTRSLIVTRRAACCGRIIAREKRGTTVWIEEEADHEPGTGIAVRDHGSIRRAQRKTFPAAAGK